jgi:hypothetical protein
MRVRREEKRNVRAGLASSAAGEPKKGPEVRKRKYGRLCSGSNGRYGVLGCDFPETR